MRSPAARRSIAKQRLVSRLPFPREGLLKCFEANRPRLRRTYNSGNSGQPSVKVRDRSPLDGTRGAALLATPPSAV